MLAGSRWTRPGTRGPLEVDPDRLTAAPSSIDAIEHAYLFGSRATSSARPDSDVDLAIGLAGGRALELLGGPGAKPDHHRSRAPRARGSPQRGPVRGGRRGSIGALDP